MKRSFRIIACVAAFTALWCPSKAQNHELYINTLNRPNRWVDSVMKKLSRNQKLGQLFMVRAHTNLGKAYEDSVAKVIRKEQLGGVVFFQGGPVRQAALTNIYQDLSNKVPLMIAQDGEWGLGMRLDSTLSYPYQMTLGAIQDNQLIYRMGQEIAKDFHRMGIQINFAPVIDINNNPKNPVINYRSFGDNKYNVSAKGIAYMKGMQESGLFTTAKHFPGHGDTGTDSHYDLPLLSFSKERLDSLELYPFKNAVDAGLSGAMVAHMNIPALDDTPNLPSTLSKPIITGILKEELGFKGLVFSDAMDMKGVVKYFPDGTADVKAIMAGIDVIELSENSDHAVKLIRKAIRQKKLTWDIIDEKVRKVLEAKYWMGLHRYAPVKTENLYRDLNRQESKALIQELADAAVTVIKGRENFPIKNDFVRKTAIVSVGGKEITAFAQQIKNSNPNALIFIVPKDITLVELERVKLALKSYDEIILSIHDTRSRPGSTLDYNNSLKLFIADLCAKSPITAVFANAYTIAGLPGIERSKSIVVAYQNSDELQLATAKVLQGLLHPKGKLPVTVNSFYKNGLGL